MFVPQNGNYFKDLSDCKFPLIFGEGNGKDFDSGEILRPSSNCSNG